MLLMYGGQPVDMGNAGAFAKANPLQDPRFQIPGGQPWNKTPILPGKETKEFDKRQFFIPPQLPPASSMGGIGNVAGLANSQFYGGPQMTQVPPGMVKTVY